MAAAATPRPMEVASKVNRNRWIVIIGAAVLGLIAVAVSILVGGGWGVVLLEVGGAGLAVVFLMRGQREDEDLEPGDQ